MSRRTLLLALLLAVAGGVAWGLAFESEPWTIASWVALAPLFPLLGAPGRKRWTFLLGLLHGVVAWIVALRWIVPTLQTYGGLPAWLAAISLAVLAGYLGLYHGLFALLGRGLWRRGGLWAFVGPPSLWVALEWLRTYLFGGFPWNPAGHAWVEVPGALPSSAWIGIYGVSWLLLFANGGVALAVVRRRPAYGLTAVLLPLLVLAVGARWGAGGTADPHRPWAPRAGAPVRLLQPNISNVVEPDWEVINANYRQVLAMSEEACIPGALVVWPESAAWPYSFERDAAFRRDVLALAHRGRCTILFNSIRFTGDHYYNSAYLVAPSGQAGLYDKRHLVPFGEYVPLAGVIGWLDKLARNAGNFRPAEELTLLPWGADELGMAICYEIVFPAEVAESVREGATILTTITNDAWYGDTAAPWQHYVAARFRAAENRRPLLRAAITGVSAVLAPDGTERARLDPFRRGIIEARVEGERQLSPFTRAPWLVPGASTAVALVALLAAGGGPRRFRPGRRSRGA